MKFTLSWLADHLETESSLQDIASNLTDMGLEVEEIIDPSQEFGNFSICRVTESYQHPNADRLQVCRVETWPDGPNTKPVEVEVVCGAPNARTGMLGVFAPPGTVIPGTGMRLKVGKIRGVESAGMLCSERELKISDEHDGIIDLPEDSPLGTPFMNYVGLDDPVIQIKVTPNRPDALGVRGIARDLAARGLGKLKPAHVKRIEGNFPCPISVSIDSNTKPTQCPIFSGRVIRGVKNCESPVWMQRRLEAIGLRPISALVDITNYVTFDQNRPLHAFDADKVNGGLRIHMAKGGEKVTALDGVEYKFDHGQIAISDEKGVESIAGVMGGLSTGCTMETENVFIESALWDPIVTASTGRKLKINSDARYRFERGVDPEFTLEGLDFATDLVLQICGGEPSRVVYDGNIPECIRKISLRQNRVHQLVGLEVTMDQQVEILNSLGFSVDQKIDHLVVTTPSWRPDIHGEADLVEEVARIASLGKLKGEPLHKPTPKISTQILLPAQKREQICRRTIASLGYNECVTYSFIDSTLASHFVDLKDMVNIENPIASDLDVMRPDLLPGLLKAAIANQARGYDDLALFEVGPVFHGKEAGEESLCAAGILIGNREPRQPHSMVRPVDLYDAKADAEKVLAMLMPNARMKCSREVPVWMHPNRSGNYFLQPGKSLGIFGEINPKLLNKIGIKGPAVAFTLFLDALPKPKSKNRGRATFLPNQLHHVDRDFAFVVSNRIESDKIVAAINKSCHQSLFSDIRIFDEYSGENAEKQLGQGQKSLAVSVRMQPKDKPFKDSEIEVVCSDIVSLVTKATGGKLR